MSSMSSFKRELPSGKMNTDPYGKSGSTVSDFIQVPTTMEEKLRSLFGHPETNLKINEQKVAAYKAMPEEEKHALYAKVRQTQFKELLIQASVTQCKKQEYDVNQCFGEFEEHVNFKNENDTLTCLEPIHERKLCNFWAHRKMNAHCVKYTANLQHQLYDINTTDQQVTDAYDSLVNCLASDRMIEM